MSKEIPTQIPTQTQISKLDLAERKKQAYLLYLRQYPTNQIAKAMGINPQTVRSYINERKASLDDTLQRLQPSTFAAEILEDFAQLRQETWRLFESASKPQDKARYLQLIASLRQKEVETMQRAGLLRKMDAADSHDKPESIAIQNTGPINVNISEHTLEALTAHILSSQMDRTPKELLDMRGRAPTFIEMAPKPEIKSLPPATPTAYTEPITQPPTSEKQQPSVLAHLPQLTEITVPTQDTQKNKNQNPIPDWQRGIDD